MGINVYPFGSKLPAQIKNKAGYLVSDGKPVDNLKNLLCVKIDSYGKSSKKEYALVTGIDDECRLTVLYDDSKEAALVGKEVSVVKY